MTELDVYTLGAVLLLASSGLFFIVSKRTLRPYHRLYYLMLVVPMTAAISYVVMSAGIGIVSLEGRTVNVTRYMDWTITTPILLYILTYAMYKGRNAIQKRNFIIIGGLDILMLITGLGAELSDGNLLTLLFSISTLAFLIMLYRIVSDMLTLHIRENNPALKKLTLLMAWTILALWSLYPFIWIFSPHGLHLLSEMGVAVAFLALDMSTKLGFSALLLWYLAIEIQSNLNKK